MSGLNDSWISVGGVANGDIVIVFDGTNSSLVKVLGSTQNSFVGVSGFFDGDGKPTFAHGNAVTMFFFGIRSIYRYIP